MEKTPAHQDEVDGRDMTKEQRDLINQEDKYRNMYAEQRDSSELNDPYLLLFDVFKQDKSKWNFAEETKEEKQVPHILTQWREQLDQQFGTSSIVENEQQFKKNWDEFTKGVFKDMDWSNVFCAGGAILANLLSGDQIKGMYAESDLDLFIYGCTPEQASIKLKHIHEVLTRNSGGEGNVIRTRRTVTLLHTYPFRHTQVILKIYKSPAEILLGFDIDSCCFGYDGNHVYSMERGRRAIVKRYNLANETRRSGTYEKRLLKYAKRGYAVVSPKLDRSKADDRLFYKKPWEVNGLARLLVFDYRADHPELFSVQNWREKDTESDYSGDLDIPWGPGWKTEHILDKLNYQDKTQFFANRFRVARSSSQSKQIKSEVKNTPVPGVPGRLAAPDVTEPKEHKHLFITGIDAVIEGGRFWCEFCNKEQEMLPDNAEKEDSDWKNFVPKKVIWITESPAYQDYDNGYQRKMITGSFHPTLDRPWAENVYAPEGHKKGPLPHEGKDLAPNVKLPPPESKWISRISPFSGGKPKTVKQTVAAQPAEEKKEEDYKCDGCSAKFYSQNQLRRHVRETGHTRTASGSDGQKETPKELADVLKPGFLEEKDAVARALLLITVLHQVGRLTDKERDALKAALLRSEDIISAAVTVFMMDRDVEELVDTFKRIGGNEK
eukprot:TRINITY_DN14977_c0_g1_i1.p1 TRINITY_DN14977_c0_g1~~TRINITY_DN14977_c0_g1_i1.p1  ORF type:complete len:664 (-),score=174.41 TRINITY_DN14977_c0_g1_i1:7-1998(-)